MELMQIVHELGELERRMEEKSKEAFAALESALLSMGNEAVRWAALSVLREREINLLQRSVMGVPVASIQGSEGVDMGLQASPEGTGPALDEVRQKFNELLSIIYEWSEVESSVWRLAAEIKKTQRRVNALENIFIPEYESTVKTIEEVLEESDREEFIRKKKVKSVLERKRNK
jgi:V/A-type H+-transporting ATPase subunit D